MLLRRLIAVRPRAGCGRRNLATQRNHHEIYERSEPGPWLEGRGGEDWRRWARSTLGCQDFPPKLNRSLLRVMSELATRQGDLDKDVGKLRNLLSVRRPGYDRREAAAMAREARHKALQELAWAQGAEGPAQLEQLAETRAPDLKRRQDSTLYKWTPLQFAKPRDCLVYFLAASAGEMASLRQIFANIRQARPDFAPASVLDFGSGVGSALWAAREAWPELHQSLQRWSFVDASPEMLRFSQQLAQGGSADSEARPDLRGLSWRQFLPPVDEKFHLVIASRAMMELGSGDVRQKVLEELWKRTGSLLVLAESGSRAGFRLVARHRDILVAGGDTPNLNATRKLIFNSAMDMEPFDAIRARLPKDGSLLQALQEAYPKLEIPRMLEEGHVLAPCPHDFVCPRQALDEREPCNFSARFRRPSVSPSAKESMGTELFSYAVLAKGGRPASQAVPSRLVREPIVKKTHALLRLCSAKGCLEETYLAKAKHKDAFRATKRLRSGDLVPFATRLKAAQEEPHQPSQDTEPTPSRLAA